MGKAHVGTAENFSVRPTVNGVGVALVGEAAGGPIAMSQIAPSTNQMITAGYSAQLVRRYVIASGTKLTIGSGAIFKIN